MSTETYTTGIYAYVFRTHGRSSAGDQGQHEHEGDALAQAQAAHHAGRLCGAHVAPGGRRRPHRLRRRRHALPGERRCHRSCRCHRCRRSCRCRRCRRTGACRRQRRRYTARASPLCPYACTPPRAQRRSRLSLLPRRTVCCTPQLLPHPPPPPPLLPLCVLYCRACMP
jgi:hypothetical protein